MEDKSDNNSIPAAEARRWVGAAMILATFLLAGCASTRCAPGRPQVNAELQARVGDGLGPSLCGETSLPDDVRIDDGVTADEAVAVVLWNNAAFNATLAQLGMARGDLVQSGLLRNPQFQILLPGGTKQLEWALFLPVDALLLRETRLDLSEQEVRRVAEQLVQNGLDVVRDTRVAHADLVFAVDRAALANEAVDVRRRIADLTKKQLDAGDISELEATTARIDFLRAQADAAGLQHAVAQAEARLKQLMSIGMWSTSLQPIAEDPHAVSSHLELQALIDEATTCRPDLRAASFAVASAKKRAELSRWQWLRLDVVADANSGGEGNSNIGPGFLFNIPVFDRNQGGIMTADWSVNQANQNYSAVRDQVVMEVQTAYSQARQATDNLAILRSDVLTSLEEAVSLAEKAFTDGGASYLLVLQTTSQYLDSRTQELQLVADLQRAQANLDRSVGRKLTPDVPADDCESRSFLPERTFAARRTCASCNIQTRPTLANHMHSGSRHAAKSSSATRTYRNPQRHPLTPNVPAEVAVEPEFSEDPATLPPGSEVPHKQTAGGEPNILLISRDGSSLFSGDATDERIGMKLRRIADELDAMQSDPLQPAAGSTSPEYFGGNITTGCRP